jgi:hypothetical protein
MKLLIENWKKFLNENRNYEKAKALYDDYKDSDPDNALTYDEFADKGSAEQVAQFKIMHLLDRSPNPSQEEINTAILDGYNEQLENIEHEERY